VELREICSLTTLSDTWLCSAIYGTDMELSRKNQPFRLFPGLAGDMVAYLPDCMYVRAYYCLRMTGKGMEGLCVCGW